jgi:8-oxo-dGTP diphosphatase
LKKTVKCPKCGAEITIYRNPMPTVDVIIESQDGVLLINRKNPPYGWALPGGFVDYGETVEEAIVRETREEVGLDVINLRQFHCYSKPDRDPRQHTLSVVFTAESQGKPRASDDAAEARFFAWENLPERIAFDHRQILEDYKANRWTSR